MKREKTKHIFTKKKEKITVEEVAKKLSRKKAKQARFMFVSEKKKKKKKKNSKKLTAEKIGEKIAKGIVAVKKADIAIQKWADEPEKQIKKSKGVVGRTYKGYKRAQKAEEKYAERLEKGTKAHKKRLKQMSKLVDMI